MQVAQTGNQRLETVNKIVIRNGWDRLRYAFVFEGILIIGLGLILSLLADRDFLDTGGLALVLSLIALFVNLVYNYAFDRLDVSCGRVPTERSTSWRIAHAIGFEFTLVLTSLPLIMWWLVWGFWQALAFDVAAMAGIVVYTYYFTLAYDRIFPVLNPAVSP